jgi:ribonuclease R
LGAVFLRRVHPAPEPEKLQAFAEFARVLGYRVDLHRDRFALQRLLEETRDKPEQHAIHYALLRSLKQAVYSPESEGHYALASGEYCHFTSPIRRYPDLTIHRLLARWMKTGKVGSDWDELVALGEHCSRTERRAESAERELIKWKLLTHMEGRIGERFHAIVTGVADYGFYAQAIEIPVEGLVHVSSLTDDYYAYDEESHTLEGLRRKRRYRLGDRVQLQVARVDVGRRLLDWRVIQ